MGRQTELQRSDDVAPPQRREDLGLGTGVEHGAQAGRRGVGRLGEVGPTGDDDDRAGAQLVDDLVVGKGGLDGTDGAGLDAHAAPGVAS